MLKAVACLSQDRSTPAVHLFQWRSEFEESFDDPDVSSPRRPMQPGGASASCIAEICTVLQQKVHNVLMSVQTAPENSRLQLAFRCGRYQRPIGTEEDLDDVEPTCPGGTFQVQLCAAGSQKCRCLWASIGKAGNNGALAIACEIRLFYPGAAVKQQL